jgi:L-rhamnose-H+ transport protein
MIVAIFLVVIAAIFLGVFLLPVSQARGWAWEHTWVSFSVLAMIALNWLLALVLLPNPVAIFKGVSQHELTVMACFGVAWGVGAVLFGRAMDMLGLALGYPLIMGVNASVGTFVPLAWTYGGAIFDGRRVLVSIGTLIAIAGITVCSIAGSRRKGGENTGKTAARDPRFVVGVAIAILSGTLSCLPNIGLSYAKETVESAHQLGASKAMAGNAVWLLFFTLGGIVNVGYCVWVMVRAKNVGLLFAAGTAKYWLLALATAAMWIASFYLYGIGAAAMGKGGNAIGWPILVTLSIAFGTLGGLSRGEWTGAPRGAKYLLWTGMALIMLAVLVIPFGMDAQ